MHQNPILDIKGRARDICDGLHQNATDMIDFASGYGEELAVVLVIGGALGSVCYMIGKSCCDVLESLDSYDSY